MYRKAAVLVATGMMILSSLAALSGAAGASPPAPLPAAGARGSTPNNDSEPNNDFGNATEIQGSQSFGGKIGQGDFDYFKIMLTSGATADTLTVTFTAHTGGGTRMMLFDPNRFELLSSDNQAKDIQLRLTAFLTGYYYIFLPELGPCDYTLTTVVGTAAFTSDQDNQPSDATAIAPKPGSPYSTTGTANNQSDLSDFFKVHLNYSELVSTDVLKAFIDPPPNGGFSIMLYAAGSSEVLAGSVLPDPGLNQTLTYSPAVAGDYYLRVWAHHGSGQYSLKVSLFSGMADNNGMKEFAAALDKTAPHWHNTTGDLTLGIDPDDFLLIGGAVAGQTFNCTARSPAFDAQDKTPDIQLKIWDDLNELPPTKPLADPTAYANARLLEAGNFYVQLNLTQWAGPYDLTVFTNSPPQVVSSVPNVTLAENGTDQSIKLVNVFSDPEDDPLTYTFLPSIEGWEANLTFTVGGDAARTVTITPRAGWNGAFWMEITATDPYGETAIVTVQQVWVQGINHRPEIINSSIPPVIIKKGSVDTTSLDLSKVFQDPDPGDRVKYNVTGNENIRVSFVPDPVNQIWHIGPVNFLPNIGFTGTEIMLFMATDERGLTSDPVMVNVEVREDITERLSVTEPPRMVLFEDGPGATINLAANVSSNTPGDAFVFEYVSSSANYNVRLTGSLVNVTPAQNFVGTEELYFNVTCTHGLKARLKLTVETRLVDDPPIVTVIAPLNWSLTIREGETVLFKINVSDEESLASQLKTRWVINGVNATPGLEYSFTTDYDTVRTSEGSRMFVVRINVSDGVNTVSRSWNVTVTNLNRAPTEVLATFPPDGSAFDEGAKIRFIGTGSDPDGDDLTFQWYEGTKLLGTGAFFNTTKLKPGKHNITLKVSDATSSATFNLIVKVNPKPTPGFEGAWAVAAIAVAAVAAVLLARRRN
jgi:hypothetical protein